VVGGGGMNQFHMPQATIYKPNPALTSRYLGRTRRVLLRSSPFFPRLRGDGSGFVRPALTIPARWTD